MAAATATQKRENTGTGRTEPRGDREQERSTRTRDSRGERERERRERRRERRENGSERPGHRAQVRRRRRRRRSAEATLDDARSTRMKEIRKRSSEYGNVYRIASDELRWTRVEVKSKSNKSKRATREQCANVKRQTSKSRVGGSTSKRWASSGRQPSGASRRGITITSLYNICTQL